MLPKTGSNVARENRRRSTSWASLTTVGDATRPIPSPSGASRRKADGYEAEGHQGRASPPDARSPLRGRCMASEGRHWLLPIPRSARKSATAEHLQAAYQPAVVPGTRKPQAACPQKVGATPSVIRTVDTTSEGPAPTPSGPLLRHPSFIRAVCVNALVRICAGGDQRWSSLLRPGG